MVTSRTAITRDFKNMYTNLFVVYRFTLNLKKKYSLRTHKGDVIFLIIKSFDLEIHLLEILSNFFFKTHKKMFIHEFTLLKINRG